MADQISGYGGIPGYSQGIGMAPLQQRAQVREQMTSAAVEGVQVAPPTPEEAAAIQGYYNRTLDVIGELRGNNYTMPARKAPEGDGSTEAKAAGEVQEASAPQEKSLEAKAKEVIQQNISRLDEMEKTGKPPATLPLEQAEANFKTMVDYIMKSPEAQSHPEIKQALEQDMEKARELYKKGGDNAMPFPMYLAQIMGQDDRIPPQISMSAIDFTRSFNAQ
jgi:hypothetical protein